VPSAFLHPYAKPTRDQFIRIVRGEGALLWDADGNQLIDGMGSLWYCAVGHGRAEIADAVFAQMKQLEAYSCFDPFTNDPAEALAAELHDIAPMEDSRVLGVVHDRADEYPHHVTVAMPGDRGMNSARP